MACPWRLAPLRWTVLLVCLAVLGLDRTAGAQGSDDEKKEIPEPENIDLRTKDGLELKATYYGNIGGKKTVPVVILHDFNGNRNEYAAMADSLVKAGYAVIVPDLRGHGDSTRFAGPPGGGGGKELLARRMRTADFARMGLDLEAIRKFLVTKNNEGELNLNALTVVGAGMGATMAVNWAALDWSAKVLVTGKQGQDVKGLVLASPTWSFEGVSIQDAIKQHGVAQKVAIMILVGKGRPNDFRDAKRIHSALESSRANDEDAKKDLLFGAIDTPLQGTELLTRTTLKLTDAVAKFIDLKVASADHPWSDRSRIGQ